MIGHAAEAADYVLLYGVQALLFIGVPLLALAGVLLGFPATRRRAGLRWLARGLIASVAAIAVLLALALVPRQMRSWQMRQQRREDAARTFTLTAPQTFGGTIFPAGSTVRLDREGDVEGGSVPSATALGRVLVSGAFLGDGRAGFLGDTAAAAELDGIPCAAGHVWWTRDELVRCVLDRDTVIAGHAIAGGRYVWVEGGVTDGRRLVVGTLSRPELLFGTLWPAGTLLGGTSTPPDRLSEPPAPEYERVSLCLLPGMAASVPGAVLHGPITFTIDGAQQTVSPGCFTAGLGLPANPSEPGHIDAGTDLYRWGRRLDASSPWQWNDDGPPGETR